MPYGYGSLYDDLITRAYGASSVGNPFMPPEMSSTWRGSEPTLVSLLANLVSMNVLGVNSPLRLPNWSDPMSGSLGAYAYSRFRSNQEAIGVVSAQNRLASQAALVAALTGNNLTGQIFGQKPEDIAALQRSFAKDSAGFVDMGVNMTKQFFGLEDYGYAGIRAAQQRSAFLLSGMSREANRMLSDMNPASNNWAAREAAVVGDYARAARAAMYVEKDGMPTFVRDENFMRGFRETDIAPILERVAASTPAGDDLGKRIRDVGGAAVKTLEAFRDLFGNAEDAKRLLNQMTAGGWGGMDAARLDSMTNQARGLMRLGEINGLGVQAVGSMLSVVQHGVSAAMGYTPADMAGGYVNQGVVTGVAGRFLAQQMADMRVDGSSMNPVEMQQMQARALYRATEFAGSTAGRSMMAYEMAVATGAIGADSAQARAIRDLFRSGDPESMARAAQLTASALGVDVERFQDEAFYKNAVDIVSRDKNRMDEYANMGYAASEAEDRIRVERAYANEALGSARDRALESGVSSEVVDRTERDARLGAVRRSLEANRGADGSKASRALADIDRLQELRDRGEISEREFMGQVDKLLEFVGPGFAAHARTQANAAAAEALSGLGGGEAVDLSDLKGVAGFVNENGGDASKLSKRNAVRYIKSLASSGGIVDRNLLARLEKIDANSSAEDVRAVLRDVESAGVYDRALGVSFNEQTFGDMKPTTAFGGELADMLGNIGVRRYWTDGGRGQIEDVDQLFDTTWDAVGRLAKKYGSVNENGGFTYKDGISDKDYNALHAIFDDLNSRDPARIRDAARRAADLLGGDVGATDAGGKKDLAFLRALSAENGEGVDYTFGKDGTHLREDQLADVFRKVGAGKYEEFKEYFRDDGSVDVRGLLGKMAQLQQGDQQNEALKQLLNDIRSSGTEISVTTDSNIDTGSAFGVIGLSAAASQYGGGAVVSDTFRRALSNAGEKAGWSQERIEEVGKTVQAVVNGAAGDAYTTMQQAVLRGFTFGDSESLGKIVDMFLDPSATDAQKKTFLEGVKGWFKKKQEEGGGTTDGALAAITTGIENGELEEVAKKTGARTRGSTAEGNFDSAEVVERNKGTRDWLPEVLAKATISVRVVNESIAVTEAQSVPEASA